MNDPPNGNPKTSRDAAALARAVEEVLDLLDACEPRPEFAARFRACRARLAADPEDSEAMRELHVLSAPKGFLGDGPLYARRGGPMTQREIDRRSGELVERIQAIATQGAGK